MGIPSDDDRSSTAAQVSSVSRRSKTWTRRTIISRCRFETLVAGGLLDLRTRYGTIPSNWMGTSQQDSLSRTTIDQEYDLTTDDDDAQ